jgi:hypothetical protein
VTVTGDSLDLAKNGYRIHLLFKFKRCTSKLHAPVQLKKPYSSINYNVKDVQLSFNVDKLTESSIKIPVQVMNNPGNETIKLLTKLYYYQIFSSDE